MELTQAEFQVEEGQPTKDQHGEVRDEKGSAAVVVADVGETPDVSQVDGESDDGEQELDLLVPRLPLLPVQHIWVKRNGETVLMILRLSLFNSPRLFE